MVETWSLYKLSLPSGEYYYGSTSKEFNNRKSIHISGLKQNTHHSKYLQEWYNSGGELSKIVWDELDTGGEYKIRCAEHYIIKEYINNPKCLNTRIPYPPHILKVAMEKGWREADKEFTRYYNKKRDTSAWYKTPQGKLNTAVENARARIKDYTKQNRPDMVKRWEIRLKERLYERNSNLRNR